MTFRAIWNSGGYPLLVVWRSLTWQEHRQIVARHAEPRLRQVAAYHTCLVDGPAVEFAPAGIVSWIGRQQVDHSPFTEEFKQLQRDLAVTRSRLASSAIEAAKSVVAWAFRYSFEEIDQWTAETFLERWARAEYVLGCKIEPQDPNAPPPEAARKPAGRPRGLGQKEAPSRDVETKRFTR